MLESLSNPTPRRGFLARLAAAGVGLGLGGSAVSIANAQAAPKTTAPLKSADPALDAWFAKIKGPHKQVFDAPEPNGGMVAIWPRVYLNTFAATYPSEKTPSTAVVILRHGALGLAMNDAMWSKYAFGETFKINNADGKPATSNIYASITGLPITGLGIAELLRGGVLVGACDVAMTVYSSNAATRMGLKAEEVKAEWVANLLPGVQLVPSGVMAVARAQELGCTYCFAG
jgi:intracellular sulfur oxidation DsrE/DsrF family protein